VLLRKAEEPFALIKEPVWMIPREFSHASVSLGSLVAIVRQTLTTVQKDLVNMEQLVMMALRTIPVLVGTDLKGETVTLI
jgi:hypothetical protein